MHLPKRTVLLAAVGLLAVSIAPAQEKKEPGAGPKQYVVHETFVWKAWATKGEKGTLFVAGVLNKKAGPGQYAELEPASPQGINPKILILEVKLGELPGAWPEPLVDLPVVYTQPGGGGKYESVTVRFADKKEIQLKVNDGGDGPRGKKGDK